MIHQTAILNRATVQKQASSPHVINCTKHKTCAWQLIQFGGSLALETRSIQDNTNRKRNTRTERMAEDEGGRHDTRGQLREQRDRRTKNEWERETHVRSESKNDASREFRRKDRQNNQRVCKIEHRRKTKESKVDRGDERVRERRGVR